MHRAKTIISVLVIALAFSVFLKPLSDWEHIKKSKAQTDISMLIAAAKAYTTEYGAPLQEDSRAVIRTLEGDNKRNVVFLEIKPQNISNDGYFLDPWGTPYVLNLVNPSNLWAYSFGKNKIDEGGNGDDVASWK